MSPAATTSCQIHSAEDDGPGPSLNELIQESMQLTHEEMQKNKSEIKHNTIPLSKLLNSEDYLKKCEATIGGENLKKLLKKYEEISGWCFVCEILVFRDPSRNHDFEANS